MSITRPIFPICDEKGPNSFSSAMMQGIISYRNKQGFVNKLQAGMAFGSMLETAFAETIFASFTMMFSVIFFQYSSIQNNFEWLKSSSFCILWSVFNIIANFFNDTLPASEQEAKNSFNRDITSFFNPSTRA